MTGPRTIVPGYSSDAGQGGPPAGAPWPNAGPPPHRGKSAATIAAIVLGTTFAVVVVIGLLAAIAIPVFLNQRDKGEMAKAAASAGITPAQLAAAPYCGTVVTPGMAPATAAYVRAVVQGNSRAAGIDAMLKANSPGSAKTQLSSDTALLRDIGQIKFTGHAQVVVAAYVTAVKAYDKVLASAASAPPATISAIHSRIVAANGTRANAGAAVRDELKLPRSTCSFYRPA